MNQLTLIIFAIFSTYRLARLITVDDGPWLAFDKFRVWTDLQAANKKHIALNQAIYCPYCIGIYAAVLCGILLTKKSQRGNLFLIIFGLAGMQSILQKVINE